MDKDIDQKFQINCSTNENLNRFNWYPPLQACLALSKQARKQAFELRHASYLAVGYIDDRLPGGILRDEFDENLTTKSIVLYKNNVPAASVRICLLDPTLRYPDANTLPACEMFETEIMSLLVAAGSGDRPVRAVEVTKLALHPHFMNDNEIVFGIFRMTGYLILHHDIDLVLISVCSNHIPFYRRLGYETVAPPRNHPKFNAATGLMVCHKDKFHNVGCNFSMMEGLSRQDGIYERFMRGDLVPVVLPRRAPKRAIAPANLASESTRGHAIERVE